MSLHDLHNVPTPVLVARLDALKRLRARLVDPFDVVAEVDQLLADVAADPERYAAWQAPDPWPERGSEDDLNADLGRMLASFARRELEKREGAP